ncbi:MAG: beta-ketoacyl-ACP synthase II [Actinobacteria bacterium]|jgi:3-oxoacyl-[acyl-carrier-protein] synthase II|nr:beta-ketoacyl-ACP synthase II [Actinomycetota bacterium]MBT3746537.1 beta-ketoacyl-ACP synthase II [Actinomycetota bacterium]MBT3970322.1 beta-ketoacyl-ACP synthase II [Actinomycetota bacterium]MBT4010475.1 beta-ketoacyl-ACP synthase II [Actinomycetota bacterium]MBT4303555.1 beta-ketoacyl-ACP synthase II [Actinomycetota bacterium]
MTRRRVAVTGLGVIASCGSGVDAFWDGLCGPAPEGERRIKDFDPTPYFANPKEIRRSDRSTQLALATAQMALEQAGDLTAEAARKGVIVATGIGGIATLEAQIQVLLEKGERRVSPFLVPMMMANAAAAAVSMRHGFCGPAENVCTACAAGTHAIANAARLIAGGRCDVVLAGGTEAAFTPTAVAGFTNMTAISSSGISRPFDAERDGFMMGEGAGMLVLEDWETAQERGATILAEILGGASTADAHHITAPSPGGVGAISCMQLALEEAGLTADQIGHVNAHGTSTPLNDMAEAAAMTQVFGDGNPLITSTKGITGHTLGAAGAIEAVAVVLAMQKALIPPTAGYATPDPDMAAINLVTGAPVSWEPAPAMSNSFGFGGHNGSLVIGPA